MAEPEERDAVEKYQLRFWMNSGDPGCLYQEEHFFQDRPERTIVLMLFEEAKSTFAALFPDAEPIDVSVQVNRLRPTDDYRPDLRPL